MPIARDHVIAAWLAALWPRFPATTIRRRFGAWEGPGPPIAWISGCRGHNAWLQERGCTCRFPTPANAGTSSPISRALPPLGDDRPTSSRPPLTPEADRPRSPGGAGGAVLAVRAGASGLPGGGAGGGRPAREWATCASIGIVRCPCIRRDRRSCLDASSWVAEERATSVHPLGAGRSCHGRAPAAPSFGRANRRVSGTAPA